MVEKSSDRFERYRESRDRGGAYLLAQQADDGAFPASKPDIAEYYKAVTAFQVCGQNDAAHRLCDWIRRNSFTKDGDFGPRSEASSGYSYAYLNAWVVCGAHRLRQFDLSQRGMAFVLDFFDSESGGFYSSADQRDADTKQDLMVTSMCGLAALYAGKMDVARAAACWLENLMKMQPDFPTSLYTVYSRRDDVHTEPDPGDDPNRYVVRSGVEEDQHFFNPGVAGGFLCRLYQAIGETEWLELAKEYMRVAEVASDYQFRIVRAGKVGWAASLLYTITREEKYRRMAVRIGDNLLDLQSEEGFWSGVGSTTPSCDSTAERVVWMDEILQAVSGN
jgi:hypothetical protein